jgi:N-acetylglucosamine kinase-like BadF-type ATPase
MPTASSLSVEIAVTPFRRSHIMSAMPHYLAIDAGGTTTRCLLADSDRIIARASTGSIKLQRVPQHEATLRLTMMLAEVAIAARVPLSQITRTCIGLAGITIPAVRAWATDALAATVSGELILLGDEEIALDAAFPNSSGILLIAGTGSNCIARGPDGALHRAGGHGPILGDQGGGFWIGLEALRAALQSLDSENVSHSDPGAPGLASETWDSSRQPPGTPSTTAPTRTSCHSERSEEPPHFARSATRTPGAPSMTASPSWVGSTNSADPEPVVGAPFMAALSPWVGEAATQLLTAIQSHFHLRTLPELIELGNRRTDPAPDFASLAPVVARAAAAGNPIAVSTLQRAAAELATLITQVARKLRTPTTLESAPPTAPEIPIAFTGSILTEIPAVHAALTTTLDQTLPTARLHPTPTDPLLGALHRARQA